MSLTPDDADAICNLADPQEVIRQECRANPPLYNFRQAIL
jgi:hypothetical protein